MAHGRQWKNSTADSGEQQELNQEMKTEIQVSIKETVRKYGLTIDGREVCQSTLDTDQVIWHTTDYKLVHPCDISEYSE
jgi:hypothetical protein